MGWRRQIGIWGAIVVLGSSTAAFWPWQSARKPRLPLHPFGYHALKVNGRYVDPATFRQEQNRFYQRWKHDGTMLRQSDEDIQDSILQAVIDRVTLESYLRRDPKTKVTAPEVEGYYQRYIKAQYPTVAALQAYCESVFCASDLELKQMIESYLLRLKIVAPLARKNGCAAKDSEVEAEYRRQVLENRQVTLRHILIARQPGGASEAAAQQAREVYRLLTGGAKFEDVARKYSDDSKTRERGGVLEPMTYREVPRQLAAQVFAARPGQLLPPVDSEFGWEIIKVDQIIYFAHSQNELQAMMALERFGNSPAYKEWLKNVKNKTVIEIVDNRLAACRNFKDRKYQKAGQLYEAIFSRSQDKFYARRALESYRLAQNWKKVVRLGRVAVRRYSREVPFYLLTAEGLYNMQQQQEAVRLLRSALQLSANNKVDLDLTLQTYQRLGIQPDEKTLK